MVSEDAAVRRFETAVEAVVDGASDLLRQLLRDDPELVRARSTRLHRATLLHYVAANGVEQHRQRTPANAVEVARILLQAGAEVDALAATYGGECTTMNLLVSSCHPAHAGVQVALVDTLLDFGASLREQGKGRWCSPLMTALIFGYIDAAQALVKRGAPVDNIAAAAGLGRLADTREFLPQASAPNRHLAFALAAQLGHVDVVNLLLDAGEDPDRFNPEGAHAHSTPLHQAVSAGHLEMVRLLVARGASTTQPDKIHNGTPLGWAVFGKHPKIETFLRACVTEPRP